MDKKYLSVVNRRIPHPLRNCLENFKKSCGDLDKLSKINENWKNLIGLELFQECKPLNIEKKIDNFNRQALHAKSLGFMHPTKKKEFYFEAKRPKDFDTLIKNLKKASI